MNKILCDFFGLHVVFWESASCLMNVLLGRNGASLPFFKSLARFYVLTLYER